jgi:cAMP phosphodiesterase
LENVYSSDADCPIVHATAAVLEALQSDVFNGRIWPNLIALSTRESRFLATHVIVPGIPLRLGSLRITPVALDHTVPTVGFVFEDGDASIAFVSDTAPTTSVWQVVNRAPQLKAIFLEASFPTRLGWLAERSMHLTPTLFAAELEKVAPNVRIIVVHMKAAYRDEIQAEFDSLGLPGVEVGVAGEVYRF